jgi:hypothetical protein
MFGFLKKKKGDENNQVAEVESAASEAAESSEESVAEPVAPLDEIANQSQKPLSRQSSLSLLMMSLLG